MGMICSKSLTEHIGRKQEGAIGSNQKWAQACGHFCHHAASWLLKKQKYFWKYYKIIADMGAGLRSLLQQVSNISTISWKISKDILDHASLWSLLPQASNILIFFERFLKIFLTTCVFNVKLAISRVRGNFVVNKSHFCQVKNDRNWVHRLCEYRSSHLSWQFWIVRLLRISARQPGHIAQILTWSHVCAKCNDALERSKVKSCRLCTRNMFWNVYLTH